MYALHLRTGKHVTSAMLQHALGAVDADCETRTHASRMIHLQAIERLEARGMTYSNQDFDVLSAALNFLDAVMPEHRLRTPDAVCTCQECGCIANVSHESKMWACPRCTLIQMA